MALLEVKNLNLVTPSGRVLGENLNISIRPGECLLICGPNGSGKSTLLRLLAERFANHRVAWIPQAQNIGCHLPLRLQDVLDMAGPASRWNAVLAETNLLETSRLSVAWDTASGGERQRTLIARALVFDPEVLLLDEPFNHLDGTGQKQVQGVLQSFLKKPGRAVGVVSHLAEPIEKLGTPVQRLTLGEHP